MNEAKTPNRVAFWTCMLAGLLTLGWIAAWMLRDELARRSVLETRGEEFLYWNVLRLLWWVLPSVSLMRYAGRSVREAFVFSRETVLWGLTLGLLLGVDAWLQKIFSGRTLLPSELSWSLVSAVVIAPVVEELAFRAAMLGNLLLRFRFAVANTLAAFFFLLAHLPGWYLWEC